MEIPSGWDIVDRSVDGSNYFKIENLATHHEFAERAPRSNLAKKIFSSTDQSTTHGILRGASTFPHRVRSSRASRKPRTASPIAVPLSGRHQVHAPHISLIQRPEPCIRRKITQNNPKEAKRRRERANVVRQAYQDSGKRLDAKLLRTEVVLQDASTFQ